MKIILTATTFTFEGAPTPKIELASAADLETLTRIQAATWAADRLLEEISLAVAGMHARHAIDAARAST